MTDLTGYAAACEQAIANQGLIPATDLLNRYRIPYVVEQTGGFTMVVRVPAGDGQVCITATHEHAPWLACYYPQGAWEDFGDPSDEADGLYDEDLMEFVRDHGGVPR